MRRSSHHKWLCRHENHPCSSSAPATEHEQYIYWLPMAVSWNWTELRSGVAISPFYSLHLFFFLSTLCLDMGRCPVHALMVIVICVFVRRGTQIQYFVKWELFLFWLARLGWKRSNNSDRLNSHCFSKEESSGSSRGTCELPGIYYLLLHYETVQLNFKMAVSFLLRECIPLSAGIFFLLCNFIFQLSFQGWSGLYRSNANLFDA